MQRKQQGFSLVEMMISLLIGLFLIGGVISVYLSSSQSNRLNANLRTMQEHARFAINSLRDGIQMAGYIDSYDPLVVVDPFVTATSDNAQVTVNFESATDCAGQSTAAAATPNFASNRFYISNGQLLCLGNGGGGAEAIAEGIDAMRILYGLDDDSDGVSDRYVTKGTVDAIGASAWQNQITSLRIGLLMNTQQNVKATESITHQLLDTTVTTNDRLIHQVFTTTILLRNQMI